MEEHKQRLKICLQSLNSRYNEIFKQIATECREDRAAFEAYSWQLREQIDSYIEHAIKTDNFTWHLQLSLDKTIVNMALEELEFLLFKKEPHKRGSNKKGGII